MRLNSASAGSPRQTNKNKAVCKCKEFLSMTSAEKKTKSPLSILLINNNCVEFNFNLGTTKH